MSTLASSPHEPASRFGLVGPQAASLDACLEPACRLETTCRLERLVEWVVDSRSHRVLCLVGGIWLLNAFDLALTIYANQMGLLHEQNPLARELLRTGPLSLTLFKIGLVLLGSYPLIRYRSARIAELGAFVVLIAYATVAVHWSSCYQMYCLTTSHNFTMAEINEVGGLQLP